MTQKRKPKFDRKEIAATYRALQRAWKREALASCRRRELEYRLQRLYGNPEILRVKEDCA